MGASYFDLSYDELEDLGIFGAESSSFSFEFITTWKAEDYPSWCEPGLIKEVDSWCIENLQGFFRLNYYEASFEYEDDAMAFKLAWL